MATVKTGSDVDAYCSKCQLELAHVVVAMVAGRPARVICKTCRTEHAYKRLGDAKPARGSRAESAGPRTARASRAAGASRGDYDSLMKGKDLSRAQRYKPATTFDDGDVLSHPTFGIGLVTRVLGDGKVEVMFQAGSKVLVHARG